MSSKKYNNLISEKSPYLLQHSENPVNWYPWGDKAFSKAKKENKPIFLSIGYSTCHWCHVMAHECFEDQEMAKLINENFISIKVDREERPDIDKIYMLVCQMLTGSGGWPLTIIMTPEKKPFFAGTYFPKYSKYGHIGLMDLIPRINMIWQHQKEDINLSIEKITKALQKNLKEIPSEKLTKNVLNTAYNHLKSIFDNDNGGFGIAPKFPSPHNIIFLLRYWNRTGKKEALDMVKKSLDKMKMGGIYDHIGFGFHRYSTDQYWHVPHFEKMLYDQALMALAYLETYQATKDEEYAKIAREIFTYIERDMISINGGFFSAEDADSEGIEGKYYLWTKEEIDKNFNNEEIRLISEIFNVKYEGNYLDEVSSKKNKKNILFQKFSISKLTSKLNIDLKEFKTKLEEIRIKLFMIRNKRIKPFRDDKILTDWNGLVIVALARGGFVLGERQYIKLAEKTVNFILDNLYKSNNRLLHRIRDNKAEINGFIDDYAFFIWGLIELYEATFNTQYLKKAIDLNSELFSQFWDKEKGGFYFTAKDSKNLIIRQKEIYDGAIPSGNSIAMLNLMKLYHITGKQEFKVKIEKINAIFSNKIRNNPSAYTQYLIAIDYLLGPSYSIIIVGDPKKEDTIKLIETIKSNYIPNKTLILKDISKNSPEIDNYAEYIKHYKTIDGYATAYICIDKTCKSPTIRLDIMLNYLNSKWKN
ncbi:MAG: thioredoxin domain-containing protein [Candidatus Lokiarchaeota archaeon]|nr:thioredoxin domain-containing protein [Candidatus Lokiarchaeota archaeon]